MEDYFFEFIVGMLFLMLGAVGTLIVIYWRGMNTWMTKMDNKQETQSELLIRIETRLENYDELKKKQEHDHKELRGMSEALASEAHRIDALEKRVASIVRVCVREHGNQTEHELGID